ncbi:hypothetical protein BJ912DRAFT_1061628 [Pholiota molesta]|nr:hypothetical protein BJ912DRAFT_1061628 [Pholiota molesta]
MSNPKAQAAKDKGNVAFKSGDYPLAIGHYTSALMADPRDPTYPLNRAAAYLKLGKNEDAERDCNTVLNLSPNNVKALFRRGQARVGMGKLLEAQKDFTDVLRIEPANTSAQEELKKVATLIQNEKSKKSKSPTLPMQASIDSTLNAKRRRVPIKIIDASGAVVGTSAQDATSVASTGTKSPQPATTPDTKPLPAPSPKSDILEPISSRSLKPPLPSPVTSPATPPVPPAFAAAAAALQPEVHETKKGKEKAKETEKGIPTPASFQQAKQARDTARPSRAGGEYDLCESGWEEDATAKSRVEEVQETPEVEMKSPSPAHAPAVVSQPATVPSVSELAANIASLTLPKAPTTYFDFNRAWHSSRSPEEKWALINVHNPPGEAPGALPNVPGAALLISILDAFYTLLSAHPADAELKQRVLEYMQNFARIPRFGTLVLFLSAGEWSALVLMTSCSVRILVENDDFGWRNWPKRR